MEITSLTNAKVKQWAKLKEKKYREKDQRFLVEGEHLIEEAARAGLVEAVLVGIGKHIHLWNIRCMRSQRTFCGSWKAVYPEPGLWLYAVCRNTMMQNLVNGLSYWMMCRIRGMSEPLFELPYPLDMMQSCYLHTAVMYTMKR